MAEEVPAKKKLKIHCPSCRQKLDVGELPAFMQVACPVCGGEIIVPKPFDGYLLEKEVGCGGMATVYRALDTALERTVAVKILNADLGEELNQKFLAEAKMAARVAHPAVVSIYTCAISGTTPYIVMEYMDGTTLEKVLQESLECVDVARACGWIGDLAGGLERAEKCGIVHHDIKPANMLLNREGAVKLGDFGIAGTLGQDPLKNGGKVWGSPNYLSPEKALTGVEDQTGDIYSLGATFYHLLTGQVPFPNTASLQELLTCRAHKDPVPPHEIRSGIPGELSAFVLKMMHRVPGMRPSYSQIRLFLLDFVRKEFGKKVPAGGLGALSLPERPSAGGVPGRKSSLSARNGKESPMGIASGQGKSSREAIKLTAAEENTLSGTPVQRTLRWRFLIAFGKFLLFAFFFLLVFSVSRRIIGNSNSSREQMPEKKTVILTEEKK